MWAHAAAAALGIWLMAAPAVLGYSGRAATNERIFGPIIAALAIVALWEVARSLRWANVVLGAWLALSAWFFHDAWTHALYSSLAGVGIALLSLVRGPISRHYAGGWSSLWRSPPSS